MLQGASPESSQLASNLIFQFLVTTLPVLISLLIAYRQVREAARSYRATVLIQLTQEWNSSELYVAVNYIHKLRKEWKEQEPNYKKWSALALEWVTEHAPDKSITEEKSKEWNNRRVVSQFISRMGHMMAEGYIKPDDFFTIVPEAKRLLMVLEPIEQHIAQHFRQIEVESEDWDRPFGKIGFDSVDDKYSNWFVMKGKEHLSRLDNT